MLNQPEPTESIQIPNLGGLITEDDLYYKGKVPYCSWAKTAQRIRENAPNWFFNLEPDPNGQLVWMAPNNTGYIMGYFQNVETGIKLPSYVYSVTNNWNKGIPYDEISTTDIQKAHRRCLCACACFSFGDAFELWAGLEVKEAKKEEEAEKLPEREGVSHTPEKPDEKPDENYLLPKEINPDAKELIVTELRKSPFKDQILKEFKSHFKLQVKEVTPANITLSEHGKFLRLTMEKLKEKT